MKFIVLGLGAVVAVFLVVALATKAWMTFNSGGTFHVDVGLFKTDSTFNGRTQTSDTCSTNNSDDASLPDSISSLCDRIRATAAFTIMALLVLLGGMFLVFVNRIRLAALTFALAASMVVLAWVIFIAGVQKSDALSSVSPSMGYSQGLMIAAWLLGMILAAAAFHMHRRDGGYGMI